MLFEERLKLHGLKLPAAELARLETIVAELDAAAEVVRVARPYAEEPLSVFRLKRG